MIQQADGSIKSVTSVLVVVAVSVSLFAIAVYKQKVVSVLQFKVVPREYPRIKLVPCANGPFVATVKHD